MKTLEKIFYVAIACVLPLLVACDNELDIENDEVALRVGETVTVDIKNAGKNCTAEVDNSNVVTATVKDGHLELYATDEGVTPVRLTNENNETEELLVTSVLDLEGGFWVIENEMNVAGSACSEDLDVGGIVQYLLKKNLPFALAKRYAFVANGEEQPIDDDIKSIQYKFINGQIVAEDESGGKCICTIIQRTEKSMTTQEDLTEYYQSLYPGAEITDVKRNITWRRYYRGRPYPETL